MFGRACSPAPAQCNGNGRSNSKSRLREWAGRCRIAGTPQVRPCRLGSRIHAADTPQSDTAPPRTDSRNLSGRHGVGSRCCATGSDPRLISMSHRFIHAWRGSTVSTLVDTYPSTSPFRRNPCRPAVGTHHQQRHAVATDHVNLSKVGRCRIAGCQPHGCGCQAYRGEGALFAKHCFASARTHSRQRLGRAPEGYLRRPRNPTPPRQPTDSQLLTLLQSSMARLYSGCRAASPAIPPYTGKCRSQDKQTPCCCPRTGPHSCAGHGLPARCRDNRRPACPLPPPPPPPAIRPPAR